MFSPARTSAPDVAVFTIETFVRSLTLVGSESWSFSGTGSTSGPSTLAVFTMMAGPASSATKTTSAIGGALAPLASTVALVQVTNPEDSAQLQSVPAADT